MPDVPVHPLFVGPEYLTQVWASSDVLEAIAEYVKAEAKDALRYVTKVQYYAKAGFSRHEGKHEGIRSKWDGVFAIQPWATLFRLYGFYETPQKKAFLIVSTTWKKGQKMRDEDKAQVDLAAEIRKADCCKKHK